MPTLTESQLRRIIRQELIKEISSSTRMSYEDAAAHYHKGLIGVTPVTLADTFKRLQQETGWTASELANEGEIRTRAKISNMKNEVSSGVY